MKRKTLVFSAPRQVEIREEELPALGPEEVLVETLCSAISAGTEMLFYQGRFPRDLEVDTVISALRGPAAYPLTYGYAAVGVVREVGPQVDPRWSDQLVFAFQPHASHFIARPEMLLPVPAPLSAESACFLPNMETAINLLQDGAPILGERVIVFGQGVVGLLTTALLAEFPLECLVTADCYELRRRTSQAEMQRSGIPCCASLDPLAADFRNQVMTLLARGASAPAPGVSDIGLHPESPSPLSPTQTSWPMGSATSPSSAFASFPAHTPSSSSETDYTKDLFDLAYELSGNPAALNDALALTRFSGRVVIGSWYGEKRAPLDLGGTFHRSRIQIMASQVSTITPALSARWDKTRRFTLAWQALQRIRPERWITHRFPLDQAAAAYRLLDEHPQEALQVIFTY